MGKKATAQEKKSTSPDTRGSLIDDIGRDSVRLIFGIVLILLGTLVGLAALGLAGTVGHYMYTGLTYVFGVGYYILPPLFIGFGVLLFARRVPGSRVDVIRACGGTLFVATLLGIVHIVVPNEGGIVGFGVGYALVSALERAAALVVLTALLFIALVLLFDAKVWFGVGRAIARMFERTRTHAEDDDDEPTVVVALPPENAPTVTVDERTPELTEEEVPPAPRAQPSDQPFEELVVSGGTSGRANPALLDTYTPPPLSILERDRGKPVTGDTKAKQIIIKRTLQNFGIRVEMDEITVGPTVTRYALKPAEGVRLERIEGLQKNLELALAAPSLRIEAPIPGKSLVGIEVPNTDKTVVGLGRLLEDPAFSDNPKPLLVALGRDITGSPHYADISKMPHALVAGATGAGKSVTIHALITSLLYRNGPQRLRLILVDPKRVELTLYNGIPHLLTPVITDARKTIGALRWAAKEMERRLELFGELKVRDIASYHSSILSPALEKATKRKGSEESELPESIPHIVIVIDELADIMQAYPRDLEGAIVRLAQMARASGIHLILSTQRPSVNVITGLIKANVPFRLALQVASQIDSRTILDQPGAEKLLGAGDLLYLSSDMSKPRRLQSPFITEAEVKKVVQYLTKHNDAPLESPLELGQSEAEGTTKDTEGASIALDDLMPSEGGDDEIFEQARQLVVMEQKASTSLLQRKLSIGYGRAARVMDLLEERGVIGPQNGSKAREVLIPPPSGFAGGAGD